MQRYLFQNNKAAHITAITIAVLLHLGILFWLQAPTKPSIIRQSISVTMVAPTTFAKKQEVAVKKPKHNAITSRAKETKTSVTKKIEAPKEVTKPDVQKADDRDFQTSGQVAQTATAQKSAFTKPVFNAAYLSNAAPTYPPRAKRRNMQGEVILEVLVTTAGKAAWVEIAQSSGYSLLDEAAKTSVKNWRFVPAKSGLNPIQASVFVPIEFKLN